MKNLEGIRSHPKHTEKPKGIIQNINHFIQNRCKLVLAVIPLLTCGSLITCGSLKVGKRESLPSSKTEEKIQPSTELEEKRKNCRDTVRIAAMNLEQTETQVELEKLRKTIYEKCVGVPFVFVGDTMPFTMLNGKIAMKSKNYQFARDAFLELVDLYKTDFEKSCSEKPSSDICTEVFAFYKEAQQQLRHPEIQKITNCVDAIENEKQALQQGTSLPENIESHLLEKCPPHIHLNSVDRINLQILMGSVYFRNASSTYKRILERENGCCSVPPTLSCEKLIPFQMEKQERSSAEGPEKDCFDAIEKAKQALQHEVPPQPLYEMLSNSCKKARIPIPDQMIFFTTLGHIKQKMGSTLEAKAMYQWALDIFDQNFKEDLEDCNSSQDYSHFTTCVRSRLMKYLAEESFKQLEEIEKN